MAGPYRLLLLELLHWSQEDAAADRLSRNTEQPFSHVPAQPGLSGAPTGEET